MNNIEFKVIKKLNNLYAKLKACELGFIDKYSEYYEISGELIHILRFIKKNEKVIKSSAYYKILRKLDRIGKIKARLYFSNIEEFLTVLKYQQIVKPYTDAYKK